MSDAMLKVKALNGTQCPMEGQPRTYITDDVEMEVPATAYYRRLILDGSLVDQAVPVAPAPAPVPDVAPAPVVEGAAAPASTGKKR